MLRITEAKLLAKNIVSISKNNTADEVDDGSKIGRT